MVNRESDSDLVDAELVKELERCRKGKTTDSWRSRHFTRSDAEKLKWIIGETYEYCAGEYGKQRKIGLAMELTHNDTS